MKKILLLSFVSFYFLNSFGNPSNGLPSLKYKSSTQIYDHDLQVQVIYTLAAIPIFAPFGNDNVVIVVVKNVGSQTLTNIPVTVNVTGVSTYTNTKIILSFPPDTSVLLNTGVYNADILGTNYITVSVPNDDNNTNNVATLISENTAGLYSYADNVMPTNYFGYGTEPGLILVKYPNPAGLAKVTAVKTFISNNVANIGKTVYAVVLNQNANSIISQSPNVVLTAADLGQYRLFPVSPNPNTSTPFFVGLAQTSSSIPYYPVATQDEIPTRTQAFYTRAITGNNSTLLQDTSHGRYMIQAVINFTIIPVTLESFIAKRNGMQNELIWATSQETNLKEFVIERCNDGFNFIPIGHVDAMGNSSSVSNYHFTDARPLKAINYYRLRCVDIDGQVKLSEIKTIRNFGDFDLSVYPNPVSNIMNIEINAALNDKGLISINDISGREIYTQPVTLNAGNNNVKIIANNIAAGSYILKLKLSNEVIIKQFVKD